MNTHTNPSTAHATFAQLVEAYRAHIAALVATYPAQAGNVAHYAEQLAGARIGRILRPVSTKGRHSTYAKGDMVLVFTGIDTQTVSVWSLGRTNSTIIPTSHVVVGAVAAR